MAASPLVLIVLGVVIVLSLFGLAHEIVERRRQQIKVSVTPTPPDEPVLTRTLDVDELMRVLDTNENVMQPVLVLLTDYMIYEYSQQNGNIEPFEKGKHLRNAVVNLRCENDHLVIDLFPPKESHDAA